MSGPEPTVKKDEQIKQLIDISKGENFQTFYRGLEKEEQTVFSSMFTGYAEKLEKAPAITQESKQKDREQLRDLGILGRSAVNTMYKIAASSDNETAKDFAKFASTALDVALTTSALAASTSALMSGPLAPYVLTAYAAGAIIGLILDDGGSKIDEAFNQLRQELHAVQCAVEKINRKQDRCIKLLLAVGDKLDRMHIDILASNIENTNRMVRALEAMKISLGNQYRASQETGDTLILDELVKLSFNVKNKQLFGNLKDIARLHQYAVNTSSQRALNGLHFTEKKGDKLVIDPQQELEVLSTYEPRRIFGYTLASLYLSAPALFPVAPSFNNIANPDVWLMATNSFIQALILLETKDVELFRKNLDYLTDATKEISAKGEYLLSAVESISKRTLTDSLTSQYIASVVDIDTLLATSLHAEFKAHSVIPKIETRGGGFVYFGFSNTTGGYGEFRFPQIYEIAVREGLGRFELSQTPDMNKTTQKTNSHFRNDAFWSNARWCNVYNHLHIVLPLYFITTDGSKRRVGEVASNVNLDAGTVYERHHRNRVTSVSPQRIVNGYETTRYGGDSNVYWIKERNLTVTLTRTNGPNPPLTDLTMINAIADELKLKLDNRRTAASDALLLKLENKESIEGRALSSQCDKLEKIRLQLISLRLIFGEKDDTWDDSLLSKKQIYQNLRTVIQANVNSESFYSDPTSRLSTRFCTDASAKSLGAYEGHCIVGQILIKELGHPFSSLGDQLKNLQKIERYLESAKKQKDIRDHIKKQAEMEKKRGYESDDDSEDLRHYNRGELEEAIIARHLWSRDKNKQGEDVTLGKGSLNVTVYAGTMLNALTGQQVPVAIKTFPRDSITKHITSSLFHNEIKTMRTVESSKLIKLFGISASRNKKSQRQTYSILMERAHSTLGEFLDILYAQGDSGKFTLKEQLKVLQSIAQALEALHAQKITHKDIKDSNVLILMKKGGYEVKLADFGISVQAKEAEEKERKGKTTTIRKERGQTSWQAPEIVLDREMRATMESDMYSFALLAWRVAHHGAPIFGSGKKVLPDSDNLVWQTYWKNPLFRPSTSESCNPAIKSIIEGCWANLYSDFETTLVRIKGAKRLQASEVASLITAELERLDAEPAKAKDSAGMRPGATS